MKEYIVYNEAVLWLLEVLYEVVGYKDIDGNLIYDSKNNDIYAGAIEYLIKVGKLVDVSEYYGRVVGKEYLRENV